MEKSCGVVLFNSDRFLLLQHNNEVSGADGHWDFPKGHVESGEEEIDTALRELKEETNIEDVNIHALLSRIVIVYVPAFRFIRSSDEDVYPFGPVHEYEYGVVPPFT